MILIRCFLKLALLPLWFLTVLAQGIGTFFAGIAGVVLGLLSGLLWIIAIIGVWFGGCTGQEAIQMIAVSFGAFLIPQVCRWLIEKIVAFRCYLAEKIGS